MITLYDLVFEGDRRPSPFCWRTKYALSHKGLQWTEVPVSLTEKDKIAFAESRTVPVIKDGDEAVKDSWAIALHLERVYPEIPLFKNEATRKYSLFVNGWADTAVNGALFPLLVGDLHDRVLAKDRDYFLESRGDRLGTKDLASFQAAAREKGLPAFRAALEPARRVFKGQKFLAGDLPGYPDYILLSPFLWAYSVTPIKLLAEDDPVYAWRERMLDLFDGMGRKAKCA